MTNGVLSIFTIYMFLSMTILIVISLFFAWLIYREITTNWYSANRFNTFNLLYLATLLLLLISSIWLPVKYWRLETFLSEKSSLLADSRNVKLHCNSVVDSIFDNSLNVVGHANYKTGEIVFQHSWCKNIMEYLDHPEQVTKNELISLHVFTHETMHIRGEMNEKNTECQAIQRNYRVAKLLGIPDSIAKKNALKYYNDYYPSHPYFSPECKKNGELDEKIDNSIWSI